MGATATPLAIVCREISEMDAAFARELHHACRRPEFAVAGLDETLVERLLDQQLRARDASYRATAGLRDCVINVLIDGHPVPVGRFVIADRPEEVRVVDIAVLPQWRGNGIGTQVLGNFVADHAGRPIALRVRRDNPAQRLYTRLGFVVVGSEDWDLTMEAMA